MEKDKSSERLFAMQDANWNVVAIADASAVVQERYAYSPYGVPVFLTPTFTSRASSSFTWQRLFTGQTYDTQTGLHYFRNRMLHSQVGTFITRDPIGYADGVNLYRYALNSPASLSDPYGTAAAALPMWLLYLLGIGAGVSVGTIITMLLALLALCLTLYIAIELIKRRGQDNTDFQDWMRDEIEGRLRPKPRPKPDTKRGPDFPPLDPIYPPCDDDRESPCRRFFGNMYRCDELKKDKYHQTEFPVGSAPHSLCPGGFNAVNPETPTKGPCDGDELYGRHYTCQKDGIIGPGVGCCTCCEDVNNRPVHKNFCGVLPSNPY